MNGLIPAKTLSLTTLRYILEEFDIEEHNWFDAREFDHLRTI